MAITDMVKTLVSMHNYIDPGTGSIMLQVIIAGFVGFLFMIKIFFGRVKLFFRDTFCRKRKKSGDN